MVASQIFWSCKTLCNATISQHQNNVTPILYLPPVQVIYCIVQWEHFNLNLVQIILAQDGNTQVLAPKGLYHTCSQVNLAQVPKALCSGCILSKCPTCCAVAISSISSPSAQIECAVAVALCPNGMKPIDSTNTEAA